MFHCCMCFFFNEVHKVNSRLSALMLSLLVICFKLDRHFSAVSYIKGLQMDGWMDGWMADRWTDVESW
jgi:hypothetical protein